MQSSLTSALVIITVCCMEIVLSQNGIPSTVSVVKGRQKFVQADMSRDLFNIPPVSNENGVTIRQVTVKEMPVLGTLSALEQVQHRLIDMQPCTANTPNVSPKFAVFNFGFSGKTSVGVIQDRQGKVLNTIQKEQSTFFPMGMVFFEANLDCQPSRIFQVLSSIHAEDIFPEKQLTKSSTDQIAKQFGITAQEAAAIKSAAQANSQTDPLASLLAQCKAKCAGGGGGGGDGGGGGGAGPTTKSPKPNQGKNLQKFSGALGGQKAPAVTSSGSKFQVEGNALMNSLPEALKRSCSIQKNKCADAANAGGNKNGLTVSACEKQRAECDRFQ